MRAYSSSSQEAVRASDLLKDWAGEGYITAAQRHSMGQDTICDLRRTNIFLRLALFLFTLLIAGAAFALVYVLFLSTSPGQDTGFFLLIFAALAYLGAELAVSQSRLYRYGIEEALAACSVLFLYTGLQGGLFGGHLPSDPAGSFIPAAAAVASLWIWYRFGLTYSFPAAMLFVPEIVGDWTSSPAAQHLTIAVLYAAGLCIVVVRRRRDRLTYLNNQFSIAEALLWLGIYLTVNLQLSPVNLNTSWWDSAAIGSEVSKPFYWTTWVLTWCLPPLTLARGIRGKDRFVIAAGASAAILTLVSNKSYLGWTRHTWDPMLLGLLLIGVSLFIRRWLSKGSGEVRHCFTAKRLSGKDKSWISAGSAAIGMISANIVAPSPKPDHPDVAFGGGDSGGGGASSDF